MKKMIGILGVLLIVLCMNGCSSDSESEKILFYENCAFGELKTFTEITDVELSSFEETVKEAECTYIITNESPTALDDYVNYLTEEYGFVVDTEKDNDKGKRYFVYDDVYLIVLEESTARGTVVTLTYPFNEETINTKKQEIYEECLKLLDEGDYDKTLRYCKENSIGEYEEFLKIWNYCEAQLLLAEDEYFYSEVIENLENASGLKDADALKAELEKELKNLEGVYYHKRSGNWLIKNYYCIISGGKAAMELLENKLDMDHSLFYSYDVLKIKLKSADGKYMLNNDGTTACAVGIGHKYSDRFECQYKCTITDDGMKVQAYESVYAFEGDYKKISDVTPSAR